MAVDANLRRTLFTMVQSADFPCFVAVFRKGRLARNGGNAESNGCAPSYFLLSVFLSFSNRNRRRNWPPSAISITSRFVCGYYDFNKLETTYRHNWLWSPLLTWLIVIHCNAWKFDASYGVVAIFLAPWRSMQGHETGIRHAVPRIN